ncbi:2542_t:CDS:2 [Funneliformis geosporum]|uniref:16752_t:CDS:1 n=1 Tax=Funneliformis geosporum TaxID=1117311 RepID=A0A9W4WT92_9GLOM|nr:2542_t:CDS:2 [Funneliformis geosporum]CAI2177178.1 16752_t:CDS:2 [Funneliformis geosporum]
MTSQQTVNENKSKVVQVPLNLPFDNNSSPDSNVIEIQEMHVHKPKYSRETLLPKIAQNGKPVFLSNIFSLKENKEKQVEAEPTNIESKDI